MPAHTDSEWQQGMCPVYPKNIHPAPLHRALTPSGEEPVISPPLVPIPAPQTLFHCQLC